MFQQPQLRPVTDGGLDLIVLVFASGTWKKGRQGTVVQACDGRGFRLDTRTIAVQVWRTAAGEYSLC